MNTVIPMIPSAPNPVQLTDVQLMPGWFSKLELQTDSAYSFTMVAGENRIYRGSVKVIAEESANAAGTRRLLLKIELPLAVSGDASAPDKCCCHSADESEAPMVSAHTVITVPKSVAGALVKGDPAATEHLSAAIRLLQALVGGLCHQPVAYDTDHEGGEIVADGAVAICGEAASESTIAMPLRYDAPNNRFSLDVGVPENAPIWGLIGGLRPIA